MAESFHRVIAAAALASVVVGFGGSVALGDENNGTGVSRFWQRSPTPGPLAGDPSPQMENVRKAIEALSPEQRKRFAENLMRWSNLSPEEKKALREREAVRQKYMEQEVNAAIAASGLHLEGERRVQFVKRFSEERQKIEEKLRQEMMEKRKPMVRDLVARLKAEFADSKP